MKRLSIIIPIYKVEDYVERCLSSLLNQDLDPDQFEIICVNDGSPDRSGDIVKNMQKSFSNIQIIEQENQGVSSARNNGIDIATGKYLLFIDPDDYIEKNTLKRVLDEADLLECQISFLGFTIITENGEVGKSFLNSKLRDTVFKGTEAYLISRNIGQHDTDRMWAVLFNRKFIESHKLRFLSGVPYLEDGEFIARVLCLANRCIFDGHPFYKRTIRKGSATNSSLFVSEIAINGFLLAAINLKDFQITQNISQRQRDFLNQAICKFTILVITASTRPFSLKKILKAKERLCEAGFCKLNIKSTNLEFKILGFLYNRSVFALIIYQFVNYRVRYVRSLVLNLFQRNSQ